MKLYLDANALDRLIGGDTEIEIQIRQQVVNEFAKRHLSNIAKSESFTKALLEVRKTIELIVREEVGGQVTLSGWQNRIKDDLVPKVKTLIEDTVQSTIREVINREVKEKIEKYVNVYMADIDRGIKHVLQVNISKLVHDGILEKLRLVTEQEGSKP